MSAGFHPPKRPVYSLRTGDGGHVSFQPVDAEDSSTLFSKFKLAMAKHAHRRPSRRSFIHAVRDLEPLAVLSPNPCENQVLSPSSSKPRLALAGGSKTAL